MIVLISGGRVRVKQRMVEAVMDRLLPTFTKPVKFIHGKAQGTDSYADWWARDRGLEVEAFPIDNNLDGYTDRAPFMRNLRMLDQAPDVVIVFPGGPGTRNMMEIARKSRVMIYDVDLEDGMFRVYRLPMKPGEQATVVATGSY